MRPLAPERNHRESAPAPGALYVSEAALPHELSSLSCATEFERKILKIVGSIGPTRSRVSFNYSLAHGLSVLPPPFDHGMSDAQILRYVHERFRVPVPPEDGTPPQLERRAELLRQGRDEARFMHHGGIGITNRTLEETGEFIAGIVQRVQAESGKIVVLGSGFSPIPLGLAERYLRGELNAPPVVIDMLDYGKVGEDLSRLRTALRHAGEIFPLEVQLSTVRSLLRHAERGALEAFTYTVGAGAPPQDAMGASLIINCYGPPTSTMHEQIRLLRPGGELLTNYPLASVEPADADFIRLRSPSSWMVRRRS